MCKVMSILLCGERVRITRSVCLLWRRQCYRTRRACKCPREKERRIKNASRRQELGCEGWTCAGDVQKEIRSVLHSGKNSIGNGLLLQKPDRVVMSLAQELQSGLEELDLSVCPGKRFRESCGKVRQDAGIPGNFQRAAHLTEHPGKRILGIDGDDCRLLAVDLVRQSWCKRHNYSLPGRRSKHRENPVGYFRTRRTHNDLLSGGEPPHEILKQLYV